MDQKPDIFMAMGNTAEVVAPLPGESRSSRFVCLAESATLPAAEEKGFIQDEIVPMTVSWTKSLINRPKKRK